jgi:protein-disulfide isomerase
VPAARPATRSSWIPRLLLGVCALAVLTVIVSISVGEGGPESLRLTGGTEMQQLVAGIEQQGDSLGPTDAPITISVFNDVQAPSGAEFELSTVDPLIEEYARTGDGRLELHHFSFTAHDTNRAAYAAVAAGLQDREWQYAELFLRNQDAAPGGNVTDEFLRDIANAVPELDADRWERDLDSPEVAARVQSDAKLAIDLRLSANPAVVVEGPGGTRQLEDSPTADAVRAAVDAVS